MAKISFGKEVDKKSVTTPIIDFIKEKFDIVASIFEDLFNKIKINYNLLDLIFHKQSEIIDEIRNIKEVIRSGLDSMHMRINKIPEPKDYEQDVTTIKESVLDLNYITEVINKDSTNTRLALNEICTLLKLQEKWNTSINKIVTDFMIPKKQKSNKWKYILILVIGFAIGLVIGYFLSDFIY